MRSPMAFGGYGSESIWLFDADHNYVCRPCQWRTKFQSESGERRNSPSWARASLLDAVTEANRRTTCLRSVVGSYSKLSSNEY